MELELQAKAFLQKSRCSFVFHLSVQPGLLPSQKCEEVRKIPEGWRVIAVHPLRGAVNRYTSALRRSKTNRIAFPRTPGSFLGGGGPGNTLVKIPRECLNPTGRYPHF